MFFDANDTAQGAFDESASGERRKTAQKRPPAGKRERREADGGRIGPRTAQGPPGSAGRALFVISS